KTFKFIKNSSNNPKVPSIRNVTQDFDILEITFRQAIKSDGPSNCSDPNKVLTDHKE
ncbi:19540_t:CDS:1, partial [Cetraspora pellucida]